MPWSSILERIPLREPAGVPGSAIPAVLIGIFVSLGGILFGYDTGNINGIIAMQEWKDKYSTGYKNPVSGKADVTAGEKALVVSILSAGTFFGSLIAAPAGDKIGRRWGLICSCTLFIVGVVLQVVSETMPLFVVGRGVAGFGVGMLSTLIPLYQSEIAPKWIRGFVVGTYQLSITIGLLLSAIVDNATKSRRDSGAYRIPLTVQIGWSLILISGMLFLPETPRYLIKRNRLDSAARSLAKLRRLPRNSPHLAEIAEIAQHHERELNLGGTSYVDCFRGSLGKRLLTGCLLQSLQQLSGINFIFYYSTSFFENNGLYDAYTITLITNIVNVVSTVPGLWMVEKWGRRPLLFFGAVGMAVSQIIVATIGTTAAGQDLADKVALAFTCIYIFFFACSWGPVVWVVPGEIFSLKVRAKAMSISTAANWLFNWAMAYAIPYMIDPGQGNLNLQAKVFYVWGGFCVIACFVTWGLVYETKGLTLEQVDEMYSSISRAWESHYFVPETHAPPRPRPWSGNRYSGQKAPTPTYKCHIEAVNAPKTHEEDDDYYEAGNHGQAASPQSRTSGGTFYFDFDRPVPTQQFP